MDTNATTTVFNTTAGQLWVTGKGLFCGAGATLVRENGFRSVGEVDRLFENDNGFHFSFREFGGESTGGTVLR